jgi:hypothetical protein
LNSLRDIHALADPQAISRMSALAEAKLFQKCSSALTKYDFGVSIHGISSRNITFLSGELLAAMPSFRRSKASIHVAGATPSSILYWLRLFAKRSKFTRNRVWSLSSGAMPVA